MSKSISNFILTTNLFMIDFNYNHLSRIESTKGVEAAYAESLKLDYYKQGLREVIGEATESINHTARQSATLISESVDEYHTSLKENFIQLSGSLENIEDGLVDLNYKLEDIASELNSISGLLGWGFNAVIENQRLQTLILNDIKEIGKLPDKEKERVSLIKRAIAKQNEAFFSASLYSIAIKYYKEALALYPEDPFVLSRLGFIHLYAKDQIDIEAAAEYFDKAISFALPLYYTKANLKDTDIYDYAPGLLEPGIFKNVRHQASIALYYGARSCLLLKDPNKAESYLEEALQIAPEFMEAVFLLIKAKLLIDGKADVTDLILSLLRTSPLYYFKFKKDDFFLSYSKVDQTVEMFRSNMARSVYKESEEIKKSIMPDSRFQKPFNLILAAITTGHFLGLLRSSFLLQKQITANFKTIQYEA